MQKIAVITGDIVNSTKLNHSESNIVSHRLGQTFNLITQKLNQENNFTIYRGDSIQGTIINPENSLLATIILRASVRSHDFAYSRGTDLRIAIGIGEAGNVRQNIGESQGDAFVLSGKLLDQIEKTKEQIKIITPWEDINNEFKVILSLLEPIIKNWSPKGAEAIYLYLLKQLSETEIGNILNISQSAVNQRLKKANMSTVKLTIERFESLIKKHSN